MVSVNINETGLEFVDVVVPTKTSDLTNDNNFVEDILYVHTDNNFTNTLKSKLDGIEDGAKVNIQSDWDEVDNLSDAFIKNKPEFQAPLGFTPENTSNKSQDVETDKASTVKFPSIKAIYDWCIEKLNNKVDKITGKGLSTEDYTNEEKLKLSGIEENANLYILPPNVVFDANYVHTDNNYTTLEKQNLANQSGTNTGDETQASIISKIGYTPTNDSGVVHTTGNETIAGNKTFSNDVTLGTGRIKITGNFGDFEVQQLDSKFRFRTNGTGIMFGRTWEYATTRVQQHEVTAVANVHKITNSTTGATINDGFDIGITGTGVAQIKQLENLNLEFFTNSVKVGDISNTGVWANNSGTWSTLSDERLKENITEVNNPLEKCLLLSKCVRHYNFKNQTKYATGKRTGYIAQLLRDNGFEGHVTYNKPVDEEEGILLGWEYADELYKELEGEEEVEKTRRVVVKEGEMILGIENNFVPYVFGAIEQLNNRLKALEEKLGV